MKRIPALALQCLIIGAFLFTPSLVLAQAQYEFESDEDFYYIQFNEGEGTPIKDLIILCQDITGYPIQYQEAEVLDKKIYIIGKQKVKKTKQGFFEYFQSVLVSYEFICAPYGPEDEPFFITIRQMTPAAAQRGGDLFKAQAPVVPLDKVVDYKDNPGRLITTTIQLKYVDARGTMSAMQNYFTNQQLENFRPVENTNSVIITGFATKVYYICRLLKLMDVEPIEIESLFNKRELNYAVAEELEPVLTALVAAAQNLRPGQPAQARTTVGFLTEPEPKIIAEPRTNAILITGSEKMLTKINHWVDVLDVEVDPRGDIHVYRLKNTLAVEMQTVLDEMLRGQQQGGTTSRRTPGATGTQPSSGIEAPAQIVADDASNQLVITASKTKYAELLEVIKKLDIRRKQVLIECAIVEITGRLDDALGVELGALNLPTDANGDVRAGGYTKGWGFTNFGLSTISQNADGSYTRVPNIGTGFTGGIFNGEDFAIPFLLAALKRKTNANILSMPSVLTNDNEQAMIEATDSEPTFSINQGQNSDSTTFSDYEDAGITLTISPSISAGNYLKLQVKIEVSDFDDASDLSPPPKAIRTVETAVTIPDGHTMVIGGVITDDQTETESKTPFLGDLPLLGWLFKSKSTTSRKVNLYIFVTPHIIGDDFANLDDISYQKLKQVEVLKGNVQAVDPDFEETNADARLIDAQANWIFEIPSYAEPDMGDSVTRKATGSESN